MEAVSSAPGPAAHRHPVPGPAPGAHAVDGTARARLPRLLGAALCCGLCAGMVGMVMALFIDTLEHLVFGRAISSGWQGATGVPWWRLLLGTSLGGMVSGAVWWRIRPDGNAALPSVKDAVRGRRLDTRTLVDAATQLLVVGTGSSIGKEAAPRQVSAWASQGVADLWRVDAGRRPLLVAASAGAGLAAVYNTPLAGAVMAVEVFLRPDLRTARGWAQALLALLVSCVATVTAWPVITSHPVYRVPHIDLEPRLLLGAVAVAVAAETVADLFGTVARRARAHAAGRHQLWFTVGLAGLAVGMLALVAPQVVGNGRPLAQLALDHPATHHVTVLGLAGLALAKFVATPVTFRGGASGGMITPALAVGASSSAALSLLVAPHLDAGACALCALVGAMVVLAVTQHAPAFALVFTIELAHPTAAAMATMTLTLGVGFGVHLLRHAVVNRWRARHGRTLLHREAG